MSNWFPAEWGDPQRLWPVKGQVWTDGSGDRIEVLRVSRQEIWADIRVTQPPGATWTKRMQLPFPEKWSLA